MTPSYQSLETSPAAGPLWLPSIQRYRLVATGANGWSDQYGAVPLAAAYAGVSLSQGYRMCGVWQHGCQGPWIDFSAALQCYSTPGAEALPVFVAREDQALLLKRHGYQRVRAIGLPIIYTPPTPAPRRPNSLLVVPTHTLAGEVIHDRTAFERYVEEIRAVAGEFDHVTVCVHPSCRQNGLWVNEFSNLGFEIVLGALNTDRNALVRVRALFEQFETVTTNGWGSHVAYALAFGARVSIHGTLPQLSESSLLRDSTWAAQPEALKMALSEETVVRERAWLADFRVPPTAARADVERGRWLIGAEHGLSPDEMREVLPQLVTPLPSSTPREALAGQRQAVRGQARNLAASGQKAEAVQLLLRFVRAAVETKESRFIHETLIEIAADLTPLDPAKADYLRDQAQRLSTRLGTVAQTVI